MNMRLVDPLADRVGPSPNDYPTVGEYLRALREHKMLKLDQLAESTKIRRAYLQGIEEGDRSVLPARPFAIGYVRSYAQTLGVDGDAAAARFKKDWPDAPEPFRDPVGVAHEKKKRSPLIIAVIGLILSGVVLWNVVQRTMVQEDRETATMPAATEAVAPPSNTVVAIGAATPAPAAQNLPTPYQTPGLDGPTPEMRGGVPVVQQATGPAAPSANDLPAVFTPKAAVYGAPSGATALVVLQAKKPGSLIVRGGGGAVYFARQLAAGEAFRAPAGQGLTAEVVDPAAFTLYVANESKGALVSQQTALDKLAVRPPPPATPAAVASHPGAPVAQQAAAGPVPAHPIAAQATAVRAAHRTPVQRPRQYPQYPQYPREQAQPQGGYYEPQPRGEAPQGDVAYYPQRQN